MKTYSRVIPRDLFNEAKLLKCLGRIELILMPSANLTSIFDGDRFSIEQSESDGSIFVSNYSVYYKDEPILFSTPLNSKENWPLMAEYLGDIYYVFNESGELIPSIVADIITKGEVNS